MGGREGVLPRAIGAQQAGWVALPHTGCGQLRFLEVAATWPALCGCHLTPGAQPRKCQDKTTWLWPGSWAGVHGLFRQEGPRQPYQRAGRVTGGRGGGGEAGGGWVLRKGFYTNMSHFLSTEVPSESISPLGRSCQLPPLSSQQPEDPPHTTDDHFPGKDDAKAQGRKPPPYGHTAGWQI